MKKVILTLLASIALPTDVDAEVSNLIHNICKDVNDYLGWVKANSKNKDFNIFKLP